MFQDCQVGLSFANQQESDHFRNTLEEKINQRSNRQGPIANTITYPVQSSWLKLEKPIDGLHNIC